jgi:hypothetical protein
MGKKVVADSSGDACVASTRLIVDRKRKRNSGEACPDFVSRQKGSM